MRKLEKCAHVIQKAMGHVAARHRVLEMPEFASYGAVMSQSPAFYLTFKKRERHDPTFPEERAREEVTAADINLGKELSNQEASLLEDVERLKAEITKARERCNEEKDRLARFPQVEAQRNAREEEAHREKLVEIEQRRRREIRIDLEKELDAARRAAMLKRYVV